MRWTIPFVMLTVLGGCSTGERATEGEASSADHEAVAAPEVLLAQLSGGAAPTHAAAGATRQAIPQMASVANARGATQRGGTIQHAAPPSGVAASSEVKPAAAIASAGDQVREAISVPAKPLTADVSQRPSDDLAAAAAFSSPATEQ